MIETRGKNIILRTMTQKEMRALWRKYEPEKGKTFIYDEELIDALFEKISNQERSFTVGIFTKNGEVFGQLSFENVVYSEKRCDISMFLANSTYKGKGYETEAMAVAKAYAKDVMGLKKMYSDVSSKNTEMQQLLKDSGFNHTKTLPKGARDGGDRLTFFAIL